jgi:hypothetical protein
MLTQEDFDQDEEFDVFWEILGGKTAPPNANPKTVAEFEAFRKALFAKLTEKQQAPSPEIPKLIIIVLIIPPLVRFSGGCADKNVENSLLSLTTEDGKLYKKEKQSSLTIYRGDDSWRMSFRTVSPELVGKEVSLVIANSEGEIVYTSNETLEEDEDEELWEFNISLPTVLDLTQPYTIKIEYSNEDK